MAALYFWTLSSVSLIQGITGICPDSSFLDHNLETLSWYWSESLSRVLLFVTPWTIQSLEFSRPEYWSGFRSVQSVSGVWPLWPDGPQHARPPGCPSPTIGVHPNPCPLSQWCHPTISSSVVPFSTCLQSFPASGSFPMSQLFASGGQSIRVSASTSVLPMNTQDSSPLGWTG